MRFQLLRLMRFQRLRQSRIAQIGYQFKYDCDRGCLTVLGKLKACQMESSEDNIVGR